MPRFLSGANIAGRGLRERLRSATFALFGAVTAVGLVLVGIAYNQGWPDFVEIPIPGAPSQHVGDARVVAQAPPPPTTGSTGRDAGPSGQGQVPVPDRDQPPGAPLSTGAHSTGGVQAPPGPDPTSPSNQGGAGAPPAGITDPEPGQGHASVPTVPSDGADEQPVTTSPPGKGKGHGKEKPSKVPAGVPPVAVPPLPESSDDDEEGDDDEDDGESHGNGHDDDGDDDNGDDDDDDD